MPSPVEAFEVGRGARVDRQPGSQTEGRGIRLASAQPRLRRSMTTVVSDVGHLEAVVGEHRPHHGWRQGGAPSRVPASAESARRCRGFFSAGQIRRQARAGPEQGVDDGMREATSAVRVGRRGGRGRAGSSTPGRGSARRAGPQPVRVPGRFGRRPFIASGSGEGRRRRGEREQGRHPIGYPKPAGFAPLEHGELGGVTPRSSKQARAGLLVVRDRGSWGRWASLERRGGDRVAARGTISRNGRAG